MARREPSTAHTDGRDDDSAEDQSADDVSAMLPHNDQDCNAAEDARDDANNVLSQEHAREMRTPRSQDPACRNLLAEEH